MHTSQQAIYGYQPIRKKGIVSYFLKFFAESTIATLATLSYCITDGIIYGFRFNRHLSMLMLFSGALIISSLVLAFYFMFKYFSKSDSLKEAVKISDRKIKSISGKVFAAALAISVTSLACTLITSAINGQDNPFLSLVRETFGFSSNGSWIGGNGGLLLCFLASSFVVFAISGLMHHYSKDNAAHRDSNSSISSLLDKEKGKKNPDSDDESYDERERPTPAPRRNPQKQAGEKIPTLAERTESLKQCGLKI